LKVVLERNGSKEKKGEGRNEKGKREENGIAKKKTKGRTKREGKRKREGHRKRREEEREENQKEKRIVHADGGWRFPLFRETENFFEVLDRTQKSWRKKVSLPVSHC
jgi:hypothetical protein